MPLPKLFIHSYCMVIHLAITDRTVLLLNTYNGFVPFGFVMAGVNPFPKFNGKDSLIHDVLEHSFLQHVIKLDCSYETMKISRLARRRQLYVKDVDLPEVDWLYNRTTTRRTTTTGLFKSLLHMLRCSVSSGSTPRTGLAGWNHNLPTKKMFYWNRSTCFHHFNTSKPIWLT